MRLDLDFDKTFPQGIEAVWRALTDPEALAAWLMRTDFAPEPGRPFRLWYRRDDGGDGYFDCEILILEPPRRMVWSWANPEREAEGPMEVAFTLEAAAEGTRLRIHHSGERDAATVEAFGKGWQEKLEALARHLAADCDRVR